jgi:uncharacterized protein
MSTQLLNDKLNNTLFPVFLKLDHFHVLIIGGGAVALEKLNNILQQSPAVTITIVSLEVIEEVSSIARLHKNVFLEERPYTPEDLEGKHLVISCVNDIATTALIRDDVHARGLLLNAADRPDYCDFYLGAVVSKGPLKIGISTNGTSPTLAKRLKEVLSENIPEETITSAQQLNQLRDHLRGDFKEKVRVLNETTKVLVEEITPKVIPKRKYKVVLYVLSALSLMVIGHLLFSFIPLAEVWNGITIAPAQIDASILWWILGGFVAQMIDGALGMAYGVSVTTFLMSFGVSPAVASASMHASEILTTGTSSLVYWRYRNINSKLFRSLLIPGAIGAVAGSLTASLLNANLKVLKPFVACYTLFLGILIIRKAIMVKKPKRKIKRIGVLGAVGGFLDSVGGGGWGPIVTSTLLAGGRDLRYTIGSAHAAKFFVAAISTITFFFLIGIEHWTIIVGLMIGGMAAAPISIWLSTKISVRNGLIFVGFLVVIISLKTTLGL